MPIVDLQEVTPISPHVALIDETGEIVVKTWSTTIDLDGNTAPQAMALLGFKVETEKRKSDGTPVSVLRLTFGDVEGAGGLGAPYASIQRTTALTALFPQWEDVVLAFEALGYELRPLEEARH